MRSRARRHRPAFKVNLGQVCNHLIDLAILMRPRNLFCRHLVLGTSVELRGFVLLEMDASGDEPLLQEIAEA